MRYVYNPSRASVQTVACPRCKAPFGAKCVGMRGKLRESNHKERVEAYLSSKDAVLGVHARG